MAKPDDLTDALIDKLAEQVSVKWRHTFPPNPGGYKKLQRLITTYGYMNVRESLQFALDARIVPHDATAMPLLTGLCRRRVKVETVKTEKV